MSGKIKIELFTSLTFLNFNQIIFYDSKNNVVDPVNIIESSRWMLARDYKYYNEPQNGSLGSSFIFSSSLADQNPSLTFEFSDLSKVASIVFYNRSDCCQERILSYIMTCTYSNNTTVKPVIFNFTRDLKQTFNLPDLKQTFNFPPVLFPPDSASTTPASGGSSTTPVSIPPLPASGGSSFPSTALVAIVVMLVVIMFLILAFLKRRNKRKNSKTVVEKNGVKSA